MKIFIDGKEALLKKGVSFDYIAENSFFTGADSYSLSITFPLAGCAQNLAIFGHINRKDCDFSKLLLDCEIIDRNFHVIGSVSIVNITEVEVKTQFLEGRSARNFHSSFDEKYINRLNLPSIQTEAYHSLSYYMREYEAQKRDEEQDDGEYLGFVCLPWVNNTSGNMQNAINVNSAGTSFYYAGGGRDEYPEIVGQPFLIEVLRQVLLRTGYDFDLTSIEESVFCDLIVCNAFPVVWHMDKMNQILPHWTIAEFLEQLEILMNGQFIIDEQTRKLSFQFNSSVLENMQTIVLDKVVDTHQVEISTGESSKDSYMEGQNIAYADCDHFMWKYYSCDWIKSQIGSYTWQNIAEMKRSLDGYLDCPGPYTHSYYKNLHYCRTEDIYFALKCVRTQKLNNVIHHYMRYQPVNVFGPRTFHHGEDNETLELKIVPACIGETNAAIGDVIFVDCGTLGDDVEDAEDKDENQTIPVNTISAGDKQKKEEYFDKLYVAFWDGFYTRYIPQRPHPVIDKYEILPDNSYRTHGYTLRLSSRQSYRGGVARYAVDQSQKFTFTFLADRIPDVRSIFYIHGRKYLAEKITATFTEDGMSQLLKMVAYRMVQPDQLN